MDNLERTILRYLERQSDGWTWVMGAKVYSKKATVEKFKKDKKFRRFIVEQAHLLAIDLFQKGSEKR
jgi:hypothetical protein